MRELFINNQAIDLDPNTNIALTKQCNKLNDLQNRQADFSNQFVIPPTANNKRICGFPHVVASDSINPYTKLSATYIENGSELISNGVAIIEEFNGNINVTLYSGIFDFFNTIGDKSLRDLDLSEADHTFDLDGVEAGNEDESKYIYPLIQWGAVDPNNDIVDIRYQRPCIKIPFIVDKIFETAQYQKGGDVFDYDSYNALVLPVVEDSIIDETETLESFSFRAHLDENKTYSLYPSSGILTYPKLQFRDFNNGGSNSSAGWYSQGRWTAQKRTTVNIRLRAFFHVAGFQINFSIGKNGYSGGNTFNPLCLGAQFFGLQNPAGFTDTVDLIIENIDMLPGEYLEAYVGSTSANTTIYQTGAVVSAPAEYSFFEVTAINTFELDQDLSMSNLVPDIKQKDLLKDLMVVYCLVPQYDPLTRTINFVQFDTIGERVNLANKDSDRNLSDDWSDKLALNNGYQVKYRFGEYAQNNFLKWSQDDDREEVGNGIIFIDDNTLPESTDLFETVLAASIQEPNFKGDNIGVNIKRYTRVEADNYFNTMDYEPGDKVLFNGVVYITPDAVTGVAPPSAPWQALEFQYDSTESVEPRILLVRDYTDNGSPPTSDLTYTDGSDSRVISNAKIAYFADSLQPYDLTFQFIINEHYQTLVRVLTKTKILVAEFKLTDNDFKNIDFFKPVYVQYFGNYFYKNQISNYISGRLTSCELVRI
jgi:hypothetical protein